MAFIIDIASPEFKDVKEKALKKVEVRDVIINRELGKSPEKKFQQD